MTNWWLPIGLFFATFLGAYFGGIVARRTFSKEWERLTTESRRKTQQEFFALMKQLEEERDGRDSQSRSE